MAIEIKLPELGDGIDSVDVLELLVGEGDVIEKDQSLLELETDKATVEVPSTHAGTIIKIHVSVGQTLTVGATLVTLDAVPLEPTSPSASQTPPAPSAEVQASRPAAPAPVPAVEPAAPTTPRATEPAASPAASDPVETPLQPPAASGAQVAAGPAIRRLAREIGVDLGRVTGSGIRGRITRDDVLAVVRKASRQATSDGTVADDRQTDGFGPVRLERMSKIRRTIAAKMNQSWTTAPRVTNFDDADVSELEEFRQGSKADYATRGIKLTAMPFLIKAVALSLKNHPLLNASLDMENQQIIFKDYVNIGIAVDTDRGLVVPSLRSADEKSIFEIATGLKTLAESARTGSFSVDDLQGGTFTISNLGAVGGVYSTPIINVPEVAILLAGRSRKIPVVVGDKVEIRLVMPLSLSYDHRLVDGAAAARFLNEVIGLLETPSRLLLGS